MASRVKGFFRDVVLRLDRAAANRMQDEAEEALRRAGGGGMDAFEKELAGGGKKAARALTRALNNQYKLDIARARKNLADGIINEQQFAKKGRDAAKAFNRGLNTGMNRLKGAGQLDDAALVRLTRRFKRVQEPMRQSASRLSGALTGAAAGFAGMMALDRIAGWYRGAIAASDRLDASTRKLAGTAKITGQNLGFLQKTAAGAKREFGLSTAASNEFAIELTKLTSKAGQIDQTSEAIRAFINLGAAKGLSTAETLQAVQQSILGIDEGTDKLFGKNPSVLYKEFADAVGVSAGSLSDAGKAQAILSAAMNDGGKVAEAYAEYLKSPAGQAEQLRIKTEEAAAAHGRWLNVLRTMAIPVLAKLSEWSVKFVGGVRLIAAEFPVFAGHVKLWAAQITGSIGEVLDGVSSKIIGFYNWSKTLPEGVQWLLGFKLGQATIGRFAEFIHGSVGGGVEAAKNELARLEAEYRKTAKAIVDEMTLAQNIVGSTDALVGGPVDITTSSGGGQGTTNKKTARAQREEIGAEMKARDTSIRWGESMMNTTAGNLALEGLTRQEEILQEAVDAHRSAMSDMEMASQSAASGITSVFAEAFGMMIRDGVEAGDVMAAISSGIAEALLDGLAQYASGKVAQNIAEAFESFAKAAGYAASGNLASAALATQAGGGHIASAAKWSLLAAGAGAASAAAGGTASSSPSGQSGGYGNYNGGSDIVQEAERHTYVVINNKIDPLSSGDTRVHRLIYESSGAVVERYGSDAFTAKRGR